MPSPKTSTSNGFTLVEFLVAMSIFILVAGLGLFVSMDFYRSYAFRSQSSTLVATLKRARSRAMDNIDDAPHGVFVASTSYTLFEGPSYAARTSSQDEIFSLDGGTRITGISEVVFTQLSGQSTASGTMMFIDDAHTATISFNHEGRISQ